MGKAEIPDRIWVQWYGEDEFADDPLDATVDEAVTWCVDKINEHDVEYVRVTKDKEVKEDRPAEALVEKAKVSTP